MSTRGMEPARPSRAAFGIAQWVCIIYAWAFLALVAEPVFAHGGQFSAPPRPVNTPKPGSPRQGGGTTPGFEPSWRNWWDRNREEFFDVRKRRLAKSGQGENQGKYKADTLHVPATREDIEKLIVPVLLAALKDKDGDVRDAAAIATGRAGRIPCLAHLKPLLNDSNRKVREAALLGMGLLQHTQSEQAIIETMKERNLSFRERGVAAIALGLSGGDRAEAALSEKLGALHPLAGIPRVKLKGFDGARALGIGLTGKTSRTSDLVAAYLKSRTKDDSFRPMALTALAKLGGDEAASLVKKALQDRDNDVRRSAAILAGRAYSAGDEKKVKALLKAHQTEKDAHTRQFLLISLGRLGHPLAVKHLNKVLRTARKKQERAFAALGLGIAKDRDSLKVMHKIMLKEKDQTLRGAVAVAIGIMNDKESGKMLAELLDKTGNPELRADLITALAMLDRSESLAAIRKITGDAKNSNLVRACGLALALLQDSSSLDLMVNIMRNSGSIDIKGGMATALGRTGDRRVIEKLVKLATNSKETNLTRAFSIVALGLIGDKSARSDFSRVSIDSNYPIQNAEAFRQVIDIF